MTPRVALVTGASRGIGRAVAQRLAQAGAAVVVAARTQSPRGGLEGSIDEVVDEITAAGGRALAVACDVSDPDACRALVAAAEDAFGAVDVLVNNAALTVPEPRPRPHAAAPKRSAREALSIVNFPLEAYRRAFEVNLFSAYALMQLVLPGMMRLGRGNVVNVSSDAAHAPAEGPYAEAPGVPLHAYGTSKAALEHLTRTVAYEMAPHGVAVNAVLPSMPVSTPGSRFASGGELGRALPMDRFVDAVELLCSVPAATRSGTVSYSEDLLDPDRGRAGWRGDRYL